MTTEGSTRSVNETQIQINSWRTPTDLLPASFDDAQPPASDTSLREAPATKQSQPESGTLDKLLPLIGKINNGGLDMSTILGLLDQSGQGLGALGKLLPLVAPLMQNNFKKKSTEDIVDLSTINLDKN